MILRIPLAATVLFTCGLVGCSPATSLPMGHEGCPDEQFLGILDGRDDCGSFPGQDGAWVGSPLFELQEGYLGRFCSYSWSVKDSTPDASALPGPADGVVGLTRDCPVVTPQGDGYEADKTLRVLIHDLFMAHVGKPALPPDEIVAESAVSLFVIDTIPDSLLTRGLTPNSRHGLTLREIISGLVCEDGACVANVSNVLGLPRLRTDVQVVDRERGGYYGSLSDLARGVVEATATWLKRTDGTHLLMLVAAGWEPRDTLGPAALLGRPIDELLTPTMVETVPPPVQAILAALVHAACQDAVLIAAAGNASGAACTQSGPVGPAFLTQLAAPTPQQCARLGFRASASLAADAPSALLYAASHVGLDGTPLSNARDGATASLVAQGVAVGTRDGTSETLTGSSVAAAVTSVTAAWVWSYFPSLSAAEVMQLVHDSGEPVPGGSSSDFQPGTRPLEVRQVSVCNALRTACSKLTPDRCDSLPQCAKLPDRSHALTAYSRSVLSCADGPTNWLSVGAEFPDSSRTANACGQETVAWSKTAFPAAESVTWPWAEPTPPVTYCPRCLAVYSSKPQQLTAGLAFSEEIDTDGPIIIEVTTATGVHQYTLATSSILWDRTNVVAIKPSEPWSDVTGVRVVYNVKGPLGDLITRGDPLMVVRDVEGEPLSQEDPSECSPNECNAPAYDTNCDDTIELSNKTDKSTILRALGICDQDSVESTVAATFDFDPDARDDTWQVARGFGSSPESSFKPTDGSTFVMLSTGAISAPGANGVVIEAPNSQVENHANGNSASDVLPSPLSPLVGSNGGLGGTPFRGCDNGDGDNDCSDSINLQWKKGGGKVEDRIYMRLHMDVPKGVTGYSLDLAFCSSEWPGYVNTDFNDMLIIYQVDPTLDDLESEPPTDAYSGNVALIDRADGYLPISVTALDDYFQDGGYTGDAEMLKGTGFENHACTDWHRVRGAVRPWASLTLGVFLSDFGDVRLASVALLDNFRWECSGCSEADLNCGTDI